MSGLLISVPDEYQPTTFSRALILRSSEYMVSW